MKFLLSCCGGTGCGKGEAATAADKERNKRSEERRDAFGGVYSTTAAAAERRIKMCRGRSGTAGAEWKPTLGAIEEDKTLVIEADKAAKRKEGPCSCGYISVADIPDFPDDYRGSQYRVMPMFASVPFML